MALSWCDRDLKWILGSRRVAVDREKRVMAIVFGERAERSWIHLARHRLRYASFSLNARSVFRTEHARGRCAFIVPYGTFLTAGACFLFRTEHVPWPCAFSVPYGIRWMTLSLGGDRERRAGQKSQIQAVQREARFSSRPSMLIAISGRRGASEIGEKSRQSDESEMAHSQGAM